MGGSRRSALLVFLLLAVLSGSLAARAWLLAPKGTVFVGTFYYVDDFYNYLGQVEQAQRGALVFKSLRSRRAWWTPPCAICRPMCASVFKSCCMPACGETALT